MSKSKVSGNYQYFPLAFVLFMIGLGLYQILLNTVSNISTQYHVSSITVPLLGIVPDFIVDSETTTWILIIVVGLLIIAFYFVIIYLINRWRHKK